MNLQEAIEQYEKESGLNAYSDDFDEWGTDFVEWLASRPTCGVEQRKLLDEIEKLEFYKNTKYKETFENYLIKRNAEFMSLVLGESDFPNVDLEKVSKGE